MPAVSRSGRWAGWNLAFNTLSKQETLMSRPKQIGGARRLTTLGSPQLAVVGLGVLALLVLLGVMIYPSLNVEYITELGIRQFESQYSFRTGDVTVPASGSQPARVEWGIVSVAADGGFGRIGVRSGDVPFEYHG